MNGGAVVKDRLRLLLVSQPLEAGVTRHVFDLVRGLDHERYTIDVACPRESELWGDLAALPAVRRHAIAPHRKPAFADAATLRTLLPLVRRADVIHAHSSKAGFVTRLAAALAGRTAACVFTPHMWSFWAAPAAAPAWRALERLAARWCSRIITVCEDERRGGLAHGIGTPDQYRVIRNGVDLRRFTAPPAAVDGRLVMVARLAAPKRPDLAVRAVAALAPRFPRLSLDLIGDGPQRHRLEALAAALGISDRVRLLGRQRAVPERLATAQCAVLATDCDVCPLAVLEASAAGLLVVASRIGGIPEILEHGVAGVIVAPGSVEALAAGLEEVLSDPQRARRMGEAGRRRAAAEFSTTTMVAEIERVYAGLVDATPPLRGAAAQQPISADP